MRSLLTNRIQKAGAAVALFLAISVVLLHYPFGRYDMSRTVWPPGCPVQVSDAAYKNGRIDTSIVLRESQAQFDCEQSKKTYVTPFEQWISYDAVIPWLIPAKNALIALLIVVLAGLTWTWIFRDEVKTK